MKRILSLTLALVLLPVGTVLGQAQLTNHATAKIKADIVKRTNGDDVTIRLRDGSVLKGRVTQTSENMFTLKEGNSRTSRDIRFDNVERVNKRGLSKGAKFGILTAFVAGAVVIGALISLKHSDPFQKGVLR